MTEWLERAECRDMDPVLFDHNDGTLEAIAACARCEVREECGEQSADDWNPVGYRAGLTASQRRKRRRVRTQLRHEQD